MDDFGTGYSSLSYLTSIDFDTVKLDRSLITEVVHDKVQQKVVNSIIAMIKSLERKIVVEGIEEYNQFTLLRELNCDIAQGYLIARPLDDKALTSALHDYRSKNTWFGET
jgi:EAL domain-containing protein (putative c-di-GMP-specific phosphodiesterase class I)